jgi:DNA-directed RNA polymerase subunit omega
VEIPTKNLMQIVIQEILEDKIYLDRSGNVAIKGDVAPNVEEFDDGPGLDDFGVTMPSREVLVGVGRGCLRL